MSDDQPIGKGATTLDWMRHELAAAKAEIEQLTDVANRNAESAVSYLAEIERLREGNAIAGRIIAITAEESHAFETKLTEAQAEIERLRREAGAPQVARNNRAIIAYGVDDCPRCALNETELSAERLQSSVLQQQLDRWKQYLADSQSTLGDVSGKLTNLREAAERAVHVFHTASWAADLRAAIEASRL